jgi:WhiB family transcriptional regulator, redox-sensing transcriptional regulator
VCVRIEVPRPLGAHTGEVFNVSVKQIVWRELGSCRGLEPSIFYPEDDEDAGDAKSICAQCAVRVACLEFALSAREKQGVWGGATERERRRIIRQRRRTA